MLLRIGKVINDLQDDYELRETSPDMEEDRFRHTDIQVVASARLPLCQMICIELHIDVSFDRLSCNDNHRSFLNEVGAWQFQVSHILHMFLAPTALLAPSTM